MTEEGIIHLKYLGELLERMAERQLTREMLTGKAVLKGKYTVALSILMTPEKSKYVDAEKREELSYFQYKKLEKVPVGKTGATMMIQK